MLVSIRSLWIWTAIIVLIVLWLPLVAVVRLFDRDPAQYHTGRWFRRLGATMTRVNPTWNITVGGEHIENPRTPYVVVSNHQSNADIPVISRLPWEMKWVAKAELFKVPFVGWMMRMASDMPVNRGAKASRAKVLVYARGYLQKRCSVMFFPEGTRSRDGRVYDFNDGAFLLAIKEQVPVLPLVIDGTINALPKHDWKYGETQTIRLEVLPPVSTEGLKAGDTQVLRARVRDQIIARLATWRGVPITEVDALVAEVEG